MANNALSFGGDTSYVACGNGDPSATSLSVGAWIQWSGFPNTANDSCVIVSKHTLFGSNMRWWFGIDKTSGKLLVYGNGAIFPSWNYTPPSNGTKAHLVWVHDTGASLDKLYVNGAFHSSFSSITLGGQAGAALQIGASQNGANEKFKGIIDGVFINSGVVSLANITNIYNGLDPASIAGAWATWHFDEGTGTSTADSTGSNTGTLSGATLPTWTTGIEVVTAPLKPRAMLLGVG